MVFAFAATLLSTVPVLLGNEFDVNVGLKRRKRSSEEVSDSSSYVFYDDGYTKYYTYGSSIFSNDTAPCCRINQVANPMENPNNSKNCCTSYSNHISYKENEVGEGASVSDLIKDMFKWST